MQLAATPLVATVHPTFVLRKRRWESVFASDVRKLVRHAAGRLDWRDPVVVLDPAPDQLGAALGRLAGQTVAVDTETDGLDPESCNMRCVGLAARDFGVVAAWRSVDGREGYYTRADGRSAPARCSPADARVQLAAFFARLGWPGGPRAVVIHNQVFDQPVLERHGLRPPDVARVVDSVMLHRLADSEMPHDLDFLASLLTDARKWKPGHGHDAWRSDEDLHRYCALDCAVAASIAPGLCDEVVSSGQARVFVGDLEMQRLAIGMRRAGVAVDLAEQQRHAARLAEAMESARARADAATDGASVNVASTAQVADYLYKRLRIWPPDVETPMGDPSVNRDAIYQLLRRQLPEQHRAWLEALLDYRRAQKAKSSFVDNLKIGADGRVHATWNPHSPKIGRMACSDPNLTTIPDTKQDPDSLRSMFVAAPGCAFVGADYDQLHLRIIAVRAGVASWLEVFDRADRGDTSRHADLHYVNAARFYGKRIEAVEKFERTTVKTGVYAGVYAAGADTWLAQFARVRDPATGRRPFARMALKEARAMRDKWLRDTPEIQQWWEREAQAWRDGGEIRSMLHGRLLRLRDLRRSGGDGQDGGADGEGLSEIVNGAVLMTEADIAGGNEASYRVMRAIGWPHFGDGRDGCAGRGMGGAGVLMHVHDALYAEVAAGRVADAKAALRATMETTLSYGGRSVKITAKPKSGQRWSELA